jgi:HEAT repeats
LVYSIHEQNDHDQGVSQERKKAAMLDPTRPGDSANEGLKSGAGVEPPQPSEVEVVQALLAVEESSKKTQSEELPPDVQPRRSWFSRNTEIFIYFCVVLAVCVFGVWGLGRIAKKFLSALAARGSARTTVTISRQHIDPTRQAEAESLLRGLAAGDGAAAEQVLVLSDSWTGTTARTQTTDQLLDIAINRKDLHVRAAAIQAQLALEGVQRNASGLKLLEEAVGDSRQRAWALWLLGALGGRGVDPVHTAKIIGAYLDDPSVDNRAAAVNGLALLATDETVPMLLDRFRNDPSPVVQERAACGLSEAGMYTHEQRMVAAASIVGWLDDSLMSAQQRTWMIQMLQDISGKSLGTDTAAWRRWYDGTRRTGVDKLVSAPSS